MEAISPPRIRRILWAVDAFEMDPEIRGHCVETLRALALRTRAEIQPVYVLTSGELDLSVDFTAAALDQYESSAERALRESLAGLAIPGLQEPKVLVDSKHVSSHAERVLADYAESVGAGLIVAGSHGKSGLKRLLLGSFADSLVHKSRVPVLVQGKAGPLASSFDHFVFATDLGRRSRDLFRFVVTMAREWGARITLFHSVPYPVEPIVQSGLYLFGGSWLPMRHLFDKEGSRRERRVDAWSAWATRQGAPCKSVVDLQGEAISDRIVKLAGSGSSSLIIAAPHSGAISASITGSITRQVIHHAPCPVLALPPGFEPRHVRAPAGASPRAA